MRAGDVVVGNGHTFVIQGRPSLFTNNASAAVDYVAATATLNPEEVA